MVGDRCTTREIVSLSQAIGNELARSTVETILSADLVGHDPRIRPAWIISGASAILIPQETR
jgi:hypothetical protein